MVNPIDFNVVHWSAWIPGLDSAEQWQAWAKDAEPAGAPTPLDLSAFPAMLRRRLGATGKIALHTILKLPFPNDIYGDIPAVFCSQYGEVGRSSGLLAALAGGEPLSPTEFSLSVHNAVAGVYSIGRKQTQNITAISAADEGLPMAILEALGILLTGTHKHVLCVIYDAPLPAPYPAEMNHCRTPFALALILSPPVPDTVNAPVAELRQPAETGPDEQPTTLRLSMTRVAHKPGAPAPSTALPDVPLDFIRFLADATGSAVDLRCGSKIWHFARRGAG